LYAEVSQRNKNEKEVPHQDVDIETLEEKAARQEEVVAAQKATKKKNQAILLKKKQEEHIGTQMDDGLYHTDDGRKFFANGMEVSGVNNLAQHKAKSHHKSSHKHKQKSHS
jgi:hypothetical protein